MYEWIKYDIDYYITRFDVSKKKHVDTRLLLFPLLTFSPFRRRTLKNRGYAASCRIKRLEQKDELECEKGKEFEDLDKLQVEIQVSTT